MDSDDDLWADSPRKEPLETLVWTCKNCTRQFSGRQYAEIHQQRSKNAACKHAGLRQERERAVAEVCHKILCVCVCL